MSRLRSLTAVATVVLAPIVAIRYLHGLADRLWFHIDWADLAGWLSSTPLPDAVTAIARLGALAVAYWSLAGTMAYLVALLTGSERMATRLAPFTLPLVRRLADRMVAGLIAMTVIAAPLIASTDDPSSRRPRSPVPLPAVAADYIPTPLPAAGTTTGPTSSTHRPVTAEPPLRSPTPAPVERPPAPAPAVTPATLLVEVQAGDHLWGLAEQRMASIAGRPVSDHEVAPYWRATVAANLGRLRSGNPDVIMPGEMVTLPDPGDFTPRGS